MLASYSYIAAFISLLSFKKREKKVREKEKGKKKSQNKRWWGESGTTDLQIGRQCVLGHDFWGIK